MTTGIELNLKTKNPLGCLTDNSGTPLHLSPIVNSVVISHPSPYTCIL